MSPTFPDEDNDYEVGYRKPPKGSRFKKGQSGNPLGRPKRKQSNSELLNAMLDEKIQVKGKTMTVREAVFRSLVFDAIKGKASARNMLLSLVSDEEVELEEFEESLDDKIAFHEVQRLLSKREKEGK